MSKTPSPDRAVQRQTVFLMAKQGINKDNDWLENQSS